MARRKKPVKKYEVREKNTVKITNLSLQVLNVCLDDGTAINILPKMSRIIDKSLENSEHLVRLILMKKIKVD